MTDSPRRKPSRRIAVLPPAAAGDSAATRWTGATSPPGATNAASSRSGGAGAYLGSLADVNVTRDWRIGGEFAYQSIAQVAAAAAKTQGVCGFPSAYPTACALGPRLQVMPPARIRPARL